MPRKHQVSTLVDLSLISVGNFVIAFGKRLIQSICITSKTYPENGHVGLQSAIQLMKSVLSTSVPRHFYDKMSVVVLNALVNLVNETKGTYNDYAITTAFLSEVTVVLHLTEVAVGSCLKSIEFSAWPKIMRHVLYNQLYDMVGLEVLDLGSGSAGWRTSDIEKIIINSVSRMPNLLSFTLCFDCTDNIIVALAECCGKLQKIDVTASRSVTDRSIGALLKCKYLREVKLFRTSVSVSGYADLFVEHNGIENIGRCDDFGHVMQLVQNKGSDFENSFRIIALESRNFHMEHLYLLVDMCPYMTSLCLLRDEEINDLTILAALNNLRELKLLSCDFYSHGIRTVLEVKGPTIISLHLEHVDEIDLSALIDISQFCPNISSLVLYNCDLLDHGPIYTRKLKVPPFRALERLKCAAECIGTHLEFLLSNCKNVKHIQLGSSTGIGDSLMTKILAENPMTKLEELKIVYSHDLSMNTVQLLMQNCENLWRLSELENWQGISSSELHAFREELRSSNINLDTSPSVSFA